MELWAFGGGLVGGGLGIWLASHRFARLLRRAADHPLTDDERSRAEPRIDRRFLTMGERELVERLRIERDPSYGPRTMRQHRRGAAIAMIAGTVVLLLSAVT